MLHSRIPMPPMPFPSKKRNTEQKAHNIAIFALALAQRRWYFLALLLPRHAVFLIHCTLSIATNALFAQWRLKNFTAVRIAHSAHCLHNYFATASHHAFSPLRPEASYRKSKAGRLFLFRLFLFFLFTSSALLVPEQPRIGAHLLLHSNRRLIWQTR
jgi:hypothetical protein